MNNLFAKTISHKTAYWCYELVFVCIIVFLAASSYSMYRHALTPACMDGTTSTPYNGPNAPNAPNDRSKPFCSSAAADAFAPIYLYYGYSGVDYFKFDPFQQIGESRFFPFEPLGPNSTCPSMSSEGLDTMTVTVNFQSDRLVITSLQEATNIANAIQRLQFFMSPFRNHNTAFQLASDLTKTYYMRDSGSESPTFRVAASTTDPPLTADQLRSTFGAANFKIKFPFISECASQFQKTYRMGPGGSGTSADGILKTGNGGICLTREMQAAVQVSIPGLIGSALALVICLSLAMDITPIRTFRYFNVVFVCINVLGLILLIAALGHGAAVITGKVAPCITSSDFSSASLMPAPTAAASNGFTPSSGGFDMSQAQTGAVSTFQPTQFNNAAVYMKATFRPSTGAGFGIAAVVLQFLFTITFGIKVDWASAGSDSSSVAMAHQNA